MKTKLTLSIDPEVIARAKEEAQRRGTSVSDMVETYLAVVSNLGGSEIQTEPKPTPKVDALIGIVKVPEGVTLDDDPKAARRENFMRKYEGLS